VSFDFTMTQAGGKLRGFDLIAIRKTFGVPFTELDEGLATVAVFWALSNRDGNTMTKDAALETSFDDIRAAFVPEGDADPLDSRTTKKS
jgi:hypothetical protein